MAASVSAYLVCVASVAMVLFALSKSSAFKEACRGFFRPSAVEVEGEANSSNNEFVAKTVENNVKLTMDRIREKSPILREMEDNGEIAIVGGVYMLSSGKVELL